MKVSWVGGLVPVFCWIELVLFSLEGFAVSRSEFWGVYGFAMALGTLSANIQHCVLFAGELAWGMLHWELAGSWWSLVSV